MEISLTSMRSTRAVVFRYLPHAPNKEYFFYDDFDETFVPRHGAARAQT